MRISFLSVLFLVISFRVSAQQGTAKIPADSRGWHLKDKEISGFWGISVDKAYDLLKGRKSETVIVAVIDSGIDTLQEDLKPVLWTNPGEKQGNGIDDDGNGYIDDHFGWNFCGSKDGTNLKKTSSEAARVYHEWKSEFEDKKERNIPAEKRFLFQQWKKAENVLEEKSSKAKNNIERVSLTKQKFDEGARSIKQVYGLRSFTIRELAIIKPETASPDMQVALRNWSRILAKDSLMTDSVVIADLAEYLGKLDTDIMNYSYKPEDTRTAYTKDNYTDINDKFYGNNNLKGESNAHGTLVAGTIAALRDNAIGSKGIVNDVRIMALRAVPDGDEHDKDIALAIRYAVDNSAQIINMSFGKQVSPYKQFVDDAIRYAETKGVLLVHSAGNDAKNITNNVYYPNAVFLDGKKASNYITVGASDEDNAGGRLPAEFSNYSKEYVDIFAPGVNIYSTSMNNTYESADGTSFAGPVVSGVSALLKSFFPKLTPQQIIEIILLSGNAIPDEVKIPGAENGKTTSFNKLSASGKIVNAYEAVKLALQWEAEKRF
ncbi:MAG TPA: S8 family serine peptidase [Ferruginibacter sp.]|nr:S8 family serine peptidase [Ferruginibacter sp.]